MKRSEKEKFLEELRALQMELVNPMLTKVEEEAINIKIKELLQKEDKPSKP